jgi:DUF4097 and DUF4098 domain-containing protein YvlB
MSHDPIVPVGNAPTFSFEIDPGKPVRLSIMNNDGKINLTSVEGQTISVVATLIRSHSGDHSGQPADDFVVEEHDNQISIRPNWQVGNTVSDIAQKVKTQLKEGFRAEDWDFKKMRFAGDASYDLKVQVPRNLLAGSTVALKSSSGEISVKDLTATTSVATASGDAQLDGVTGKVSVHSASGDVSLRNLTGSVESNTASGDISFEHGDAWTALRSVSGDISIRGVTLKNARITTVSGTISVDATINNAADYTFDSVSGDMNLTTRVPNAGATLTYRSMSGDASVRGDWTKGSGKRSWTIGGGEGGSRLAVKTVSGDLRAEGTIGSDVEARSETMPTDVEEHGDQPTETTASSETTPNGEGDGPNITVDADWEKAKGWLKDITSRVSKFVNELDAAGNQRYEQSKRADESPTEAITVEPLDAEATSERTAKSETEPLTPPVPPTPTEPIPPVPPTTPEAPQTPPSPEPAPETTAQRRLRLLEAVQRGELTVDEALAQLDGPNEA